MLILLPSSETKRAPTEGPPLDLGALSFPALGDVRRSVLDAVVETSRAPDALRRLMVGPSMGGEVARNTGLLDAPTAPVLDLYEGTLYGGLAWRSLGADARRRAERDLVVASSAFGLLRPSDRIPAYRLDICSRLVGMGGLEATWRTVVPAALADAMGQGIVVDLRSGSYQALGFPAGATDRTVTFKVEGQASRVGNVIVKRVRGQVARHLLETGAEPGDPVELARVLAEAWSTRLAEPARPNRPWTLTVVAGA